MSTVASAAAQLADRQLVLMGDERGDAAFLACAADGIDATRLERLHDLGRGMVVLAVPEPIARQLALPKPWAASGVGEAGLTAPIDAAAGITYGWSPRDRALTMRVASDPSSRASDLTIPGHVYPTVVPERARTTPAAALELAQVSGRAPAVALCPVVDRHGRPVPLSAARADRALKRLAVASPAELHSGWTARHASELAVDCSLPTRDGTFRAVGYGPGEEDPATVALIHGDPAAREMPLVHVHVACLFGDAFGSLLCDCRRELDEAAEVIMREGAGVIVYAKPADPAVAACARGQRVDPIVAAGLLRAAGVEALRLLGGQGHTRLREELRACGMVVA